MAELCLVQIRETQSMSESIARTMIDAYGRHVLVSTINRETWTCEGRWDIAETLVFDLDSPKPRILDQCEAPIDSRASHDAMVLKWSREKIEGECE